jgi:DNA-binding NtrC family response regulator
LFESPHLAELFGLARQVAQSPDTPVLILGEKGAGAEDLARFIHHEATKSRGHRFTAVHCRRAAEEPIERALEEVSRRAATSVKGKSETLFLDEVGALGAVAQDQVVLLLEDGRSTSERSRSRGCARVIASTREPLGALVERGLFREELLDALSVVRLRIPPLRERPDDIVKTADHLVREKASRIGKPVRGITSAAKRKLRAHGFPGNLRELDAVIERAVIYESSDMLGADSIVFVEDTEPSSGSSLPDALARAFGRSSEPPSLEELERTYITWLIGHTHWNRSAAARILGVSYPTIAKKIADYKIEPPKSLGSVGTQSAVETPLK